MHVQAFFAEPAVERLNRGIVGRLAPPTEVEDDAVGVHPQVHRRADELRAVVAVDALRQSAFEAQTFERADDISTTESLTGVDGQAFARQQIEDCQRSEASPICELVGDEVHRPDVIPRGRWASLLTMHCGRVSPRPLPPQRESLLGVEAIAPLLAEVPALAPQEHQQPAIPESDARLRQLPHPLPQRGQRIATALIANAGETEAGGFDCPSLTDLVAAHQVVHHFALPDGLQNFF